MQRLSLSRMIDPQQQQKRKKQRRNLNFSAISSLSGFTSVTLVLLFSQFSVSSFDFCVFFLPCSLVFSRTVRIFHFSHLFRSFPLVEGPNPDTFSRIRFSDFLRTYSASAAAEAAAATAWRHCEALVGGLGRFFLVQVVTSLSLAEHALTGRRYLFCRSTIALFQ